MVPRGRPPLERGVLAFDVPGLVVPEAVVLDTSFVVEALLPSQPHYLGCRSFLERLMLSHALVVFNRLLELELAEAAYKIALKERFGKGGPMTMRGDGRALRRAARLAEEIKESWSDTLSVLAWRRVELDDVVELVPELMSRGLASYDAVHAATATVVGVGHIVTLDTGFGRTRESDLVILVDHSRLASCRKHRTRAV